jgi:hypothetical protein
LQNVENSISGTYGVDQRRFIQSYVTNEFFAIIAPHAVFLNRLILTHPSMCDTTGPLYFMLTRDTKTLPVMSKTRHFAREQLTSFCSRVSVFRHRVAAHVMPEQSVTDRNDWSTAMEILPSIRVFCR